MGSFTFICNWCGRDNVAKRPDYSRKREAAGLPSFCGHKCSNGWKAANMIGLPYSQGGNKAQRKVRKKEQA